MEVAILSDEAPYEQVAQAIAYINFLFRANCMHEITSLRCDITAEQMVLYTADSTGFTETYLWNPGLTWTPQGADLAPQLNWISTEET